MPVPRDPEKIFSFVMNEFRAGRLHSGSGGLVTDQRQAFAIAASMTREAKKAAGEKPMAKRRKKAAKKTGKKRSKATKKVTKKRTNKLPRRSRKSKGRKPRVKKGARQKMPSAKRKIGKKAPKGAGVAYLAKEHKRLVERNMQLEKKLAACDTGRKKVKGRKLSKKTIGRLSRAAKKAGRKHPGAGSTTAHKILSAVAKPAARRALVAWACVGPRRTGCGGGKAVREGSHVLKGALVVGRSQAKKMGLLR